MFGGKKLSALSSSSLVRREAKVQARLSAAGQALWQAVKKPWVAPVLAFGALVGTGVLFLGLAADPEAGSPQVRVNLARAIPLEKSGETPSGPDYWSEEDIFGTGGFGGLAGNDPVDGTAVITLPDDGAQISVPDRDRLPPRPLPPAPIAALHQAGPDGSLPVIAADGRTPAQAYARPFSSNGKPKVALIVGGLGLNPTTTRAAIEQLPAEVTLSFVPYAEGLQGWIDMARAQGHEVLIEVPMEPVDYPATDPGPQTLLTDLPPGEMRARLNWVLSRGTGYYGVINYQGSAFLRDKAATAAFTLALRQRGLSFIDDGQGRGVGGAFARASADRVIDGQLSAASIQSQLAGIEATAKARGQALGAGFAYPVTLAVAIRWIQGLEERGLQLAPASAIARS